MELGQEISRTPVTKGMSYLISVRMVNLHTNTEEVLEQREGSRCHFMKWFSHNNFDIQLRLDWEDCSNGEPILDADIIDKKTGQLVRKVRCHHTKYEYNPQAGRRIYDFDFQGLKLRLYRIETREIESTVDMILRREDEEETE